MKYQANIHVPAYIYDDMQKLCSDREAAESGGERPFNETVRFQNENEMDVQVCQSRGDVHWCQGVLYDSNGAEINCTEVMDNLSEEFWVGDETDSYSVKVVRSADSEVRVELFEPEPPKKS